MALVVSAHPKCSTQRGAKQLQKQVWENCEFAAISRCISERYKLAPKL